MFHPIFLVCHWFRCFFKLLPGSWWAGWSSVGRNKEDETIFALLEILVNLLWFGLDGHVLHLASHVQLNSRTTNLHRELNLPDAETQNNKWQQIKIKDLKLDYQNERKWQLKEKVLQTSGFRRLIFSSEDLVDVSPPWLESRFSLTFVSRRSDSWLN